MKKDYPVPMKQRSTFIMLNEWLYMNHVREVFSAKTEAKEKQLGLYELVHICEKLAFSDLKKVKRYDFVNTAPAVDHSWK